MRTEKAKMLAGELYDATDPELLKECNAVNVLGQHFTLQYKSARTNGVAGLVTDREEKIAALRAICERFLPKHIDAFDEAMKWGRME